MMLLAPFMKYITGGLALLALALSIALWASHERGDRLQRRVSELTELRKADRKAYETAQKEAELKNKATVQKIEAENEKITDSVRTQYQRDLERLRLQSKANRGAPGGAGVSSVPKATGGADGSPQVCVSGEDALRSAETELKLLHLQAWLRQQMAAPK